MAEVDVAAGQGAEGEAFVVGDVEADGELEADRLFVLDVVAHEFEGIRLDGVGELLGHAPGGEVEQVADADVARRDHVGEFQAVAQAERLLFCQRVVHRHDRIDRLFHRHDHLEFFQMLRFEHQGEIALKAA